jgi:hypothetical protein
MSSKWQELLDEVPKKFEELRLCQPLPNPKGAEFKGKKGIYAFRQDGNIIHVGRTRNLQQRMQSHHAATHNKASLAFKLTRRQTGKYATYKPEGSRSDLLKDPLFHQKFLQNIEDLKRMEVIFVEIGSHELQYLVELYACIEFGLPTDEFDTS